MKTRTEKNEKSYYIQNYTNGRPIPVNLPYYVPTAAALEEHEAAAAVAPFGF